MQTKEELEQALNEILVILDRAGYTWDTIEGNFRQSIRTIVESALELSNASQS